jgi:diguanylate cyclase (GGDEF)-like protein
LRSSPLSTIAASALSRIAPKAALGCWLLAALAVLALAGLPASDPASVLFPGLSVGSLQTRARLAAIILELMSASWLFLALFGHKPLGSGLKTCVKLVTHTGIVLLGLIVGSAPQFLIWITVIGTLACAAPLVVAGSKVAKSSHRDAIRWFVAGGFAVAGTLAFALLVAGGHSNVPISLALIGTTSLAAFAWCMAVAEATLAERAKIEAAHDKVVESARKYRHVYYSVPIALMSIDMQGNVLRWNEKAQQAFGKGLVGGRLNPVAQVIGEKGTEALLEEVRKTGRHQCEVRIDLTGELRTYAVDAIAAGTDIELSFGDVSERSKLTATLEHIAHHDFLTGCLNRRGLERELDSLLARIATGFPSSFIYVDLDRFKAINDVFGHAAGDAIVLEVARRLGDQLPPGATVGRIGGDEFLAVLPGLDLAAAKAEAQRILTSLTRETVDFEGLQMNVEASIGVIEATPGMQTRELLAYADEACAQSKRSGRGRITALDATNELLVNYRAEKLYGSQLKFRLPTERMRIFAQPIVPLQTGFEIMSYEVLLRTEDEHGRIEAPARLIAAAERQGAMAAIDRFVLSRTVAHLAEHPAHTRDLGFVSVNLSGMSLNDDRFVNDAIALLREHRAIASKICLEITESVALYDISSTRRFVDEMHAIGATIALDDFGAGYTSFAYLKDLPATLLKIDGQFITGLGSGAKNHGIVRAIQQVGRELGMQCLAEWVEDEATLKILVDLDVDYAQGYVFARAKPIETWLNERVDLTPLLSRQATLS